MRTVETKIYTFDELSSEAQEYVLDNFWAHTEYPWHDENMDCLKEFTDLFDFSVYHWRYDSMMAEHNESFPEYYFNIDGDVAREWFKRQSKIIYDLNCPLTGYYLDETLLQPIRDFIADKSRTDSIGDVLTECVGAFFSHVVADVEHHYSMESCAESCAVNEYEFLENGEFYS